MTPGLPPLRRLRSAFWIPLLSALLLAGCGGEPPPPPEKPVVRPVKALELPRAMGAARSFPGTVRATTRVDLSFNVPGSIVELPAREGERVTKGTVLARLDARNYQMQVNAAKAEYEEALADYRRYKELVAKGHVSRADFDRMEAKKTVAEAKLDRTRKLLEDTVLRAPFDGVVARRFVENYTDVKAKQPVLSLQDTRQLEVVADVPEDLVIQDRPKELEMTAEFSALPGRKLPVTIKEYSTRADPNTLTYRVVFALPEIDDANILPGMTARITLTPKAGTGKPAFLLPASALLEADGKRWLWVIDPDDNRVSRREVQAQRLDDGRVKVTDGVEPGERVAVAGVHSLKEGMVVKPVREIQF